MKIRKINTRYFPLIILIMGITLLVRVGDFADKIMVWLKESGITLNMANAEDAKDKEKDSKAEPEEKSDGKADTKTEEGKEGDKKAEESADSEDAPADIEEDDEKRPPSEVTMLQQLNEQRQVLAKREVDLNSRDALLKAAELQFQQKMKELSQLKTEIEGLLKQAEDKQEKQMASLIKIYETMKPKDAANIMNTLETNVLLDLTGRMKEGKLAPILAAMNPDRARQITTELAERAEKIPKTDALDAKVPNAAPNTKPAAATAPPATAPAAPKAATTPPEATPAPTPVETKPQTPQAI